MRISDWSSDVCSSDLLGNPTPRDFRPSPWKACKMTSQHLTSPDNYFENFAPGQRMRHARGKTIGENETVILAHLTMNTAQGHFNAHDMAVSKFGSRITYGGVTASIVVGLASEDTSENALADVAPDTPRLKTPEKGSEA